jgi:hypothetical protein
VSVGTGLDEGIESLRQALLAASADVGLEVHVRLLDPPRVPDLLDAWDHQGGEHKLCPQPLEVILRIDRAPGGRLAVDGGFVTNKWTDQIDLRARGWEGHVYPDRHAWEIDLGDRSSLTPLLDDLMAALFAIGAQAGTRISFDIVHGAVSSAIAPDEGWVDGASAADVQTRLLALADARGGSVAVALTTRPGAIIRLEARRRWDSLVVIGRLAVDRESAAMALRAAGWRRDREQGHLRRSWRLPRSGPVGVSRDQLFADLAQALATVSDESIGGAISARLETRDASVVWRGEGSEYARGCGGWALASAGTVLAIIALGVAGFDFPAWPGDALRALGAGYSIDQSATVGRWAPPLVFAGIASMLAAFGAAGLVIWLADRVRARYAPALLIAEVTAAAVTVVFFVALGLAGDSWVLLAASIWIGLFASLLIRLVTRRLRRSTGPR